MKIVFHHEHPLPVLTYGGIERILFWHMKELAKKGHHVVLIGHPDSKVKDHNIELISLDLNAKDQWQKLIPKDSDIVHLSYNGKVDEFPTIVTNHGNGQPGEKFHINTVFVSKKHAEIHNSNQFIHNAVDFSEYPFIDKKINWDRFLFLAKASWRVKNLKQSVAACRANNKHLEIIGGRWWGLSRYIHSHGMQGGDQKLKIIRNADALLFPVRWHEPFGIAVIEAMSQGLPVIGSPYGSLPELISKESGVIANNFVELKKCVKDRPFDFNAIKIREYAESNFNISKHGDEYLNLYKKVSSGEKLNSHQPSYIFDQRATLLLDF